VQGVEAARLSGGNLAAGVSLDHAVYAVAANNGAPGRRRFVAKLERLRQEAGWVSRRAVFDSFRTQVQEADLISGHASKHMF
jgi:hypothetical protein